MIQVIIRAIDILEFVATHETEPAPLIKIAEHVGLSQPTTANIVKTLLEKNYLEQIGRKKGYRLGIAAFRLTRNPSYQQNLITAAKGPMEELTEQLNETSILATIRNNKRVILHQVECNQVLKVNAIMITDVYNASTSRLLMAYLPLKELNSLLKSVGLPTKTNWPGAESRAGLDNALKKIREEEFVQTISVYHTVGFAVPIYNNKEVVAALSIFVPQSRYTDSHKEKIAKLIRKAANKITDQLQKSRIT
ncbi:MAG: IclR family transcriptional regulator [Gloeobacteraceae cyanobacterium ES-bin-316]|nr:IclR family transcriptional regulator [Ferruginibacter sp.]